MKMENEFLMRQIGRRTILRGTAAVAGGFIGEQLLGIRALGTASVQQATAVDAVAQIRAQWGAAPIHVQKLADNLTLLSGPGGNVVVLSGTEGKVVVDTFFASAWPRLKETLDGLGGTPVKYVIDTHWHFDHTDNNAAMHAAGATIVAHENTKKRMSETHDLPVLGFHFDPSPGNALPQETFGSKRSIKLNGETLELEHLASAHTDTDIYVLFEKANVVHMGDTFFNGLYPYIDSGTGGKIAGMIAAADKVLEMTTKDTKIVPGHGPLGSKDDLTKFRELLLTARNRVEKLKSAGKTIEEAVAAKPLGDLDATWAKGMLGGDQFVRVVYLAL